MNDEERRRQAAEERLDRALSAFVDGELDGGLDGDVDLDVDGDGDVNGDGDLDVDGDANEEAALRARLSEEPRLAARLAGFEAIDEALRALPGRDVPSDLRARLQARIDGEATGAVASLDETRARRGGSWGWAAAAALAAGLALFVVMKGGPGFNPVAPNTPESDAAPQVARAGDASGEDAGLLAVASDEELGIALDYETLDELEIIEQLELLELLADFDAVGFEGDGESGQGEQG